MTMGASGFTYKEGLKKAEETYGQEQIVAIETEYDTPRISHCHIELPVSWAYVDTNGKITVVASIPDPPHCQALYGAGPGRSHRQSAHHQAIQLAADLETSRMCLYEPLNAFLSLSVGGRPVRLEISREETFPEPAPATPSRDCAKRS